MLPSNRRQCNTLDHRACPEGRAVTRQYAVPAIRSLFNIAQSPKSAFTFSSNLLSKTKDRAAFAGGPSQGGNARGRAATAGGSHRVSYFANPKAPRIDEAQFPARIFAWRPFVLLPITPTGHGRLVQEGMLRQP